MINDCVQTIHRDIWDPIEYTFLYLKQNVLYWPDDDRLQSKHVAIV